MKALLLLLGVICLVALSHADVQSCESNAITLFTAHNNIVKYFWEMLPTNKDQHADCNTALQNTKDSLDTARDQLDNREFEAATNTVSSALGYFAGTYSADTCNMDYGANQIDDFREAVKPTLDACDGISRDDSDGIIDRWYTGDRGISRPDKDDSGNTVIENISKDDVQDAFYLLTQLPGFISDLTDAIGDSLDGITNPFANKKSGKQLLRNIRVRQGDLPDVPDVPDGDEVVDDIDDAEDDADDFIDDNQDDLTDEIADPDQREDAEDLIDDVQDDVDDFIDDHEGDVEDEIDDNRDDAQDVVDDANDEIDDNQDNWDSVVSLIQDFIDNNNIDLTTPAFLSDLLDRLGV